MDDYYRTPEWLVSAVLKACPQAPATVLDAGAGDGVLARAVIADALDQGRRPPSIWAVEQDPDRGPAEGVQWVCGNFLSWSPPAWRFDLAISNPPFSLWDDFVRALLPMTAPQGTCLVLGFVNVLGGQGRAPWWRDNPPSRIWLSPRRASFTEDGQTDPRDCAWFEWSSAPRTAQLRWLGTER